MTSFSTLHTPWWKSDSIPFRISTNPKIPPVEIAQELLPNFHRTEKPLGGNFNQTIFEFPPDCLKSLHTNRLP
jgi:hypothetical protein